tara:strand:+ start:1939 stop:2148 length:210 start_codon:yes stop_codon:yes gene_type:complete
MSKSKPCPTCDGMMGANSKNCLKCFTNGLGVKHKGNKLSSKEKEKEKTRWQMAIGNYKKELDKRRNWSK